MSMQHDLVDALVPFLGQPVRGPFSTGRGLQASYRCPFHGGGQEHRPSFFLHLEWGAAFCHRCGDGWMLPSLLAALNVPMAMRTSIAALAVLDMDAYLRRRRALLFAQSELVPEALLGLFRAGGCPTKLLDAGFSMPLLLAHDVGYDTVHERITYPVRNWRGQLVGIAGGATRPDQHEKYRNYVQKDFAPFFTETPPRGHDKTCNLGGIDKLWAAGYLGNYRGPIPVVEGYKARLWVIQAGFPLAQASFGAYLSDWQINALAHFGNEFVLFTDWDEGGREGDSKGAERLRKEGVRVSHAIYPDRVVVDPEHRKFQPDDLITEEVQAAILRRTPWVQRSGRVVR